MMSAGLSMFSRTPLLIAATLLVSFFLPGAPAEAFQFCGVGVTPPLFVQLDSADSAVLVKWVSYEKNADGRPGTTTCQIQQFLKGINRFPKNQRVTLKQDLHGETGELFIVFEKKGQRLEWDDTQRVSAASVNYIVQAPSSDAAPAARFAYFLKFLENADPLISSSAFERCSQVDFTIIQQFADQLPQAKIRGWINDPEIPKWRLQLYGRLLGIFGSPEDAQLLESKILLRTDEFRYGIEGLIEGYLLIMTDKGLDVLDEHILANKNVPYTEAYGPIKALEFMRTYGEGKIAQERLQQSMRILLDRPEIAGSAIVRLAVWKDWSIQDRLMAMYGAENYNTSSIKRAISHYLIMSSNDAAAAGVPQPEHVIHGRQLLEELRKKDPKIVSEAERFFRTLKQSIVVP